MESFGERIGKDFLAALAGAALFLALLVLGYLIFS